MRSLFCVFSLICTLLVSATSHASNQVVSSSAQSCEAELDKAVELYAAGDAKAAESAFEQMLQPCSHLPQLHHNLGVIAGAQNKWEDARTHFDRAISKDKRTNMTMAHVRKMHQYRASQAYQDAFKIKQTIKKPDFEMQSSLMINAGTSVTDNNTNSVNETTLILASHETTAEPLSELHNEPTIEYELYAWWDAASQNETDAWLEHYARGYPPLENDDALAVEWNNVHRDITFTAQDAVVVLSYTNMENIEKRTMLLMRLQNERWKIYKEANL